MMLQVPRVVEMNARFVGTQVWKAEEKTESHRSVGVQWSGKENVVVVGKKRFVAIAMVWE